VGRSITLDGESYAVIGVMPEGTVFDRTFNQMWRPLAFTAGERTRNFHWLQVFARLKPGVSLEQARAEMDAIGGRIAQDFPDSNKGWGVSIVRYMDSIVGPQLRSSLYVLLSSAGLPPYAAGLASATAGFALRGAAMIWKWGLPAYRGGRG